MTMDQSELKFRAQDGKQKMFLSTPANIAIYGGAAGSGKTYALLLEPLRHFNNPNFSAVTFRRTTKQVRNVGGLWNEATRLYCPMGAEALESRLELKFPSGMVKKFGHLEYESDIYSWQGSQIPLIQFDELNHFSERMFFYLMSRNRSASGVRGYIRATCNPDADSWLRVFLDWWIGSDGFPIQERAGVLRWFVRDRDKLIWSDKQHHEEARSVTFVPASIHDNKILMEKDPTYIHSLKALPYVDRMRLLEGSWDVRPAAGSYFKKEYFKIVDAFQEDHRVRIVRYWDRAATEKTDLNDPDWTVGVKMALLPSNRFVVLDVTRFRASPHKVEERIKTVAQNDGIRVEIGIEQDPGSAGKMEAEYYVRQLAGYSVRLFAVSINKETRAKPASSQAEAGNIDLMRGAWNKDFLDELENFPESGKKDQVDGLSGAVNMLANIAGQFTKGMMPSKRNTIAGSKGSNSW